ncbi:hypothetical protein ACOMHN_052472 [Nucella lapillus]
MTSRLGQMLAQSSSLSQAIYDDFIDDVQFMFATIQKELTPSGGASSGKGRHGDDDVADDHDMDNDNDIGALSKNHDDDDKNIADDFSKDHDDDEDIYDETFAALGKNHDDDEWHIVDEIDGDSHKENDDDEEDIGYDTFGADDKNHDEEEDTRDDVDKGEVLWKRRKRSINTAISHTSLHTAPSHTSLHTAPSHTSLHTAPSHTSLHTAPSHTLLHTAPSHTSLHTAPSHTSLHTAPSHTSLHTAPSHTSLHTAPSHTSLHTASSHTSLHTAPSHTSLHTAPSHTSLHTAPSHPTLHTAPSHTSLHTAPSHTSLHTAPSHTSLHTAPSHTSLHTAPSHTSLHTAPSHTSLHTTPSHTSLHTAPSHTTLHTAPSHPSQHTAPSHTSLHTAPSHTSLHTAPSHTSLHQQWIENTSPHSKHTDTKHLSGDVSVRSNTDSAQVSDQQLHAEHPLACLQECKETEQLACTSTASPTTSSFQTALEVLQLHQNRKTVDNRSGGSHENEPFESASTQNGFGKDGARVSQQQPDKTSARSRSSTEGEENRSSYIKSTRVTDADVKNKAHKRRKIKRDHAAHSGLADIKEHESPETDFTEEKDSKYDEKTSGLSSHQRGEVSGSSDSLSHNEEKEMAIAGPCSIQVKAKPELGDLSVRQICGELLVASGCATSLGNFIHTRLCCLCQSRQDSLWVEDCTVKSIRTIAIFVEFCDAVRSRVLRHSKLMAALVKPVDWWSFDRRDVLSNYETQILEACLTLLHRLTLHPPALRRLRDLNLIVRVLSFSQSSRPYTSHVSLLLASALMTEQGARGLELTEAQRRSVLSQPLCHNSTPPSLVSRYIAQAVQKFCLNAENRRSFHTPR